MATKKNKIPSWEQLEILIMNRGLDYSDRLMLTKEGDFKFQSDTDIKSVIDRNLILFSRDPADLMAEDLAMRLEYLELWYRHALKKWIEYLKTGKVYDNTMSFSFHEKIEPVEELLSQLENL